MMTQEEMAVKIKAGEHDKLIPSLWDSVRKIYDMKSRRYYRAHIDQCRRRGVDLEDVQQQSFLAFMQSIEEYDTESGLKFISFIDYPFTSAMRDLLCIRTERQRRDPLNNCDSLDRPLETEDGDGCLHDIIGDAMSVDFLEMIDRESVAELIRAEVARLPERERVAIEGYFFEALTLTQIGEQMGISMQYVRVIKKQGLQALARRRSLVELHNQFYHSRRLAGLEHSRGNPEQFERVRQLERLERKAMTANA